MTHVQQAAALFAQIAVDSQAAPQDRRRARLALVALGAADAPAPRVAKRAPTAATMANLRAIERNVCDLREHAAATDLADLYKTRPDIGPKQREELAKVSAVAALGFVEGARAPYQPNLTAEEAAIFARLDAKPAVTDRATTRGGHFTTPFLTPDQARKRLAEMKAGH